MDLLYRIALGVAGSALVGVTVLSAVRTIVLPHGRSSDLTRNLFRALDSGLGIVRRLPGIRHREAVVTAFHAPLGLVMLPLVWITLGLVGFTLLFAALGDPWRLAFKTSGSAMLTIGFVNVDDLPRLVLTFGAAALTISFLALVLVTYLPSMYQTYSGREIALFELETLAGEPPDPAELIIRHHRIGAIDDLQDVWDEWRTRFFEMRETHTALPAVVLFRSSSLERSWINSVVALLDGAALWNSIRDEEDPRASLCIRAGYLSLSEIAEYFRIEIDRKPSPDAAVQISRDEYDALHQRLVESGVTVDRPADAGWQAFRGWRVNYDEAASAVRALTGAPPMHWSTGDDR